MDQPMWTYLIAAGGVVMAITASQWLIYLSIVAIVIRIVCDVPKAIKSVKGWFSG